MSQSNSTIKVNLPKINPGACTSAMENAKRFDDKLGVSEQNEILFQCAGQLTINNCGQSVLNPTPSEIQNARDMTILVSELPLSESENQQHKQNENESLASLLYEWNLYDELFAFLISKLNSRKLLCKIKLIFFNIQEEALPWTD